MLCVREFGVFMVNLILGVYLGVGCYVMFDCVLSVWVCSLFVWEGVGGVNQCGLFIVWLGCLFGLGLIGCVCILACGLVVINRFVLLLLCWVCWF